MNTQLLIYQHVVALNKQKHGDWSVKSGQRYEFAKHINSVPLAAIEFAHAAAEYSIVFVGDQELLPTVILGIHPQQNLFIADNNTWNGDYVPAFLRRYPFVFANNNGGKRYTLCIDEHFPGSNQAGVVERLFDTEGEQSQYLQSVVKFSSAYQNQFIRTQSFCKKLKELDLLEPMQAEFALPGGEKQNLNGFQAVSRQRLKQLSDEQLLALARTGQLDLIHLHLQSMKNFNVVAKKMVDSKRQATTADKENAMQKRPGPKAGLHRSAYSPALE